MASGRGRSLVVSLGAGTVEADSSWGLLLVEVVEELILLLLEEGSVSVLHGFLGVNLQLGGDGLTLVFGAGSSGGGLLRATTLLDTHQAVIDGGELALDVIELRVKISDELVECGFEVTVVAIGTHGSGMGSNWSLRYEV
jgi:hypothetical protein